jgi:hypothetical protein
MEEFWQQKSSLQIIFHADHQLLIGNGDQALETQKFECKKDGNTA